MMVVAEKIKFWWKLASRERPFLRNIIWPESVAMVTESNNIVVVMFSSW